MKTALKVVQAILTGLCLAACAKPGGTLNLQVEGPTSAGTPSQQTNIKSLFSVWTETGNSFQIDLRSFAYDIPQTATVNTITGQTCSCQLKISGTQTSGTMTFSACTSLCAQFQGTANYTNSSSGLQVCNAGSCANLK